jgi:hypothetical protein
MILFFWQVMKLEKMKSRNIKCPASLRKILFGRVEGHGKTRGRGGLVLRTLSNRR